MNGSRTRGRPLSFDRGAALDRVLPVFWRKGFDGASLDELAAAAGLVMGKTNRAPVVIIRGLALNGSGKGRDLIRPAAEDLFR